MHVVATAEPTGRSALGPAPPAMTQDGLKTSAPLP